MSLPSDSEELLGIIREAMPSAPEVSRLATIETVNGSRATVQFDGESTAGVKEYVALESYAPTIGHRVVLLRVGHSWVILGRLP